MTERQHVWVGPETTDYESECELCLARRDAAADRYSWSVDLDAAHVVGTLRLAADVGFTTCRAGHRIVVRRVGRRLARAV